MTPRNGPWAADAVVIDLRRGHIVGIALNLLLWPAFIVALLFGAVFGDYDWLTRAIAVVLILGCLVPLIALALRWRSLLVPTGFVFDRRGLYYWRGSEQGLLEWSEIAAIGLGYEAPPERLGVLPARKLEHRIADKIVKDRRRVTLDIFPRTAEAWDRAPALQSFRHTLDAPWPDVSGERWLILLPARPGLPLRIRRAAERFAPDVWRGWFRRPWGGLAPLARAQKS